MYGRIQEGAKKQMMSVEKSGRHKTEVEEMLRPRERLALTNEGEAEEHSEMYGGG